MGRDAAGHPRRSCAPRLARPARGIRRLRVRTGADDVARRSRGRTRPHRRVRCPGRGLPSTAGPGAGCVLRGAVRPVGRAHGDRQRGGSRFGLAGPCRRPTAHAARRPRRGRSATAHRQHPQRPGHDGGSRRARAAADRCPNPATTRRLQFHCAWARWSTSSRSATGAIPPRSAARAGRTSLSWSSVPEQGPFSPRRSVRCWSIHEEGQGRAGRRRPRSPGGRLVPLRRWSHLTV